MRREYPSDFSPERYDSNSAMLQREQPRTELQALMEAAPGHEPEASLAEEAELRAVFSDSMRHLFPQDRFVLEGRFYERLTYEELGERLGVSRQHATRLCEAAQGALQRILIRNPIIRERQGLVSYWQNHAEQALISLIPMSHDDYVNAIDTAIDNARVNKGEARVSNMIQAAGYALAELIDMGEYTVTEMVDLLAYKQSMYGHRNILDFGLDGVLVRMADKRSRLANIVAQQRAGRTLDDRGEGLIDTLRDIVGYAVIAIMLYEGTFTTELEPF